MADRSPKRPLSAGEKYDLWVRLLTGRVTPARAAAEAGVDRATIAKLRKVAKDGAIAVLQAARPGRPKVPAAEESELVKSRAEADRLGAVVIDGPVEQAVLCGQSTWG